MHGSYAQSVPLTVGSLPAVAVVLAFPFNSPNLATITCPGEHVPPPDSHRGRELIGREKDRVPTVCDQAPVVGRISPVSYSSVKGSSGSDLVSEPVRDPIVMVEPLGESFGLRGSGLGSISIPLGISGYGLQGYGPAWWRARDFFLVLALSRV